MAFQSTLIMVATVVLLLSLIFISISLYNTNSGAKFPPVENKCPDYWSISGPTCIDTYDLGSNCNEDIITDDTICEKKRKAIQCGLTWNGITNNAETANC